MSLIDASNFKSLSIERLQPTMQTELLSSALTDILNIAAKIDLDNSNQLAILEKRFDDMMEFFGDDPKFVEILKEFKKELYK